MWGRHQQLTLLKARLVTHAELFTNKRMDEPYIIMSSHLLLTKKISISFGMVPTLLRVCLPKTTPIEGRKCNWYHLYLQLPTVLFTDPLRYKKTPRLKQHQHQHCSNCKSMRKQSNLKLEIYEETNKLETGNL